MISRKIQRCLSPSLHPMLPLAWTTSTTKFHQEFCFQRLLDTFSVLCLCIRVRPRFFDQVGHETTNASIGNKYFFTKLFHHQTYQNYLQSRQKLGTFLVNKVLYKSKFSKNFINISWSSNQIFFTKNFFGKI